jgi:hypothetical protein
LLYRRSLPLRRTSTLAILRSEEKPYTSAGWCAGVGGSGEREHRESNGADADPAGEERGSKATGGNAGWGQVQ